MNIKLKTFIGLYIVIIISLFLYSFTQIDLSLTFSRIPALRSLVTSFQSVGYFNRPLSTYIYVSLLVLLYGFYFYFIKLAMKKKLSKQFVWKLLLITGSILVFSYNAFSYDIFNYIFDAKIFTFYHQNPYLHKALDFPSDPMLSFMRWTHRTYPYGPVWLGLAIPISYLGFNFFLPTFFLFKLLIAASFLGSLYFIGKIFRKILPEKEVLGLVFFGLNPLILIESLISGHLDMVMIVFALFATYKILNKKYFFAFLLLFTSIGIKFATVLLLPIFIFIVIYQKKKKAINWSWVFMIFTILMSVAVCLSSIYSGNFQPWYLILPLSFAVFVADRYYVFIPSVIISFFALLNYIPYLYLGNWNPPVPQILSWLQLSSIAVSILVLIIYFLLKKSKVS